MTVTHFQRRPQRAPGSVERGFAAGRPRMPPNIICLMFVSRFPSHGLWRRVYNMVEAVFHQAQVNHITGDVHFLSLLLRKRTTLLKILDCVALERLKGIRRAILRLLWYTLPVSTSRIVVAISESTKSELLRHLHCDAGKIRVIPACIDPAFSAARKEFDAALPRILQIGTGANKNLLRVAEALNGIRCEWHIVGAVSTEQEQTLSGLGLNFRALGFLDSEGVRAAYRSCDLVG